MPHHNKLKAASQLLWVRTAKICDPARSGFCYRNRDIGARFLDVPSLKLNCTSAGLGDTPIFLEQLSSKDVPGDLAQVFDMATSSNTSDHNSQLRKVDDDIKEKSDVSYVRSQSEGPPNHGVTAWLQVVGAFFIFFNTW